MQPYRLLSADEQPVAPIQAEFANMGSDDQILVEIELKWTDVVLGAFRHVLSWRRSQFIERVRVQALLGQPFELSSTGTNRTRSGGAAVRAVWFKPSMRTGCKARSMHCRSAIGS